LLLGTFGSGREEEGKRREEGKGQPRRISSTSNTIEIQDIAENAREKGREEAKNNTDYSFNIYLQKGSVFR